MPTSSRRPTSHPGSIALGSVKSNIGHLKAAAGAAGLLKATLALHAKVDPAQPRFPRAQPQHRLGVVTVPRQHRAHRVEGARRAACVAPASARSVSVAPTSTPCSRSTCPVTCVVTGPVLSPSEPTSARQPSSAGTVKAPRRGALVLGAETEAELGEKLPRVQAECRRRPSARTRGSDGGGADARRSGSPSTTATPPNWPTRRPTHWRRWREVVRRGSCSRAAASSAGAVRPARWPSSTPGRARSTPTCSARCAANEPVVAATFAEADEVMTPLLGRPLTDVIFVDPTSPERTAEAEDELRHTEITQPAVLAVDIALTRLLGEYGVRPRHGDGPQPRRVRRARRRRQL